jgi:rod shape-determining protein MreD
VTFTRANRLPIIVLVIAMLLLQYFVRPRFWPAPAAPDFLLVLLIMLASSSRPGAGAVTGFLIGLLADAFTPAALGAAMLAHTLVGYLASWARAVFFAENYLVHAGLFFAGCWLRNLLVLLFSGTSPGGLLHEAVTTGLLQAVTTAVAGTIVVYVAREWFDVRLEA